MASCSMSTLLPQSGSGTCRPCNASQNRLHLRSRPRSPLGDSPALDHTPELGQFKFRQRDNSQYSWHPGQSGLRLASLEAWCISNLRYHSGTVAICCFRSTSSWARVATFRSPAYPTQWASVLVTSTLPPFHRHLGCPWCHFWARRGWRLPCCWLNTSLP